jgi:ribonucleoside-diphosphate reductase alpha chain
MYQFKYADMEFSKDGQLDELIALDRYAVPTYDDYEVGNTVVAIVDKQVGNKKVGEIVGFENEDYRIKDRLGEIHQVKKELMHKPLELKPVQLWSRWAKGAASVEKTEELKLEWESKFRKLTDGYGYSLGGRIQLMLGQEYVTGNKANLTAYNCYVTESAQSKDTPFEQFKEVLRIAYKEASIMRRGGGVGMNISHIETVKGSGHNKSYFKFVLPSNHADFNELQDRKLLDKFDSVEIWDSIDTINDSYITVGDSIDELFESLDEMVEKAYNSKSNEIVVDFSQLRHRNAIVRGVNGRSSGSVSWMELFALVAELLQLKEIDNIDFAEVFSHITHLIEQGGSRRGALMLVCNVDNKNIKKFIERKKNPKYLTGANISVGISDSFMSKVKSNNKKANETWSLLIGSAWKSAEPGILFLERMNKESNSQYYNVMEATNPCGEQPLPAWGVCNLGHFVLPRYFNKKTNDVDWELLSEAIHSAVRMQDNIIDYTPYFLKENQEVQLGERRVGIGSMGLGTLMIKLGLRYGSDNGNEFIDRLYKFIAIEAYKESIQIAEEKGAFPKFDAEKMLQSDFMKRIFPELPQEFQDKFMATGIRNVTILTQAPTGSTGTYIDNIPNFRKEFGGTTTGVEPYFSWEYWRAGRLGMNKQTVDLAKEYLEANNLESVDELPEYFVTAMDLEPSDHVKVQGAIQKWTDSSISKTANCPNEYTVEQTADLYMQAYDLGLKGMTIYRDGSRSAQVLATNEADAKLEIHVEAAELKKRKEELATPKKIEAEIKNSNFKIQKRPKRLYGFTEKVGFAYGDKFGRAYVTINLNDGDVWEVFVSTKEKEVSGLAKALGLMTTKLLRLGGATDNLQQAIDTLTYDQVMGTLPYAVANILKQIQKESIEVEIKTGKKEFKLAKCVECGKDAYDKGNCICLACGTSKCN